MIASLEHRQRIARLMPLEEVMRRIVERVRPVSPREMQAAATLGCTLAQDIVVANRRPAAPLALIDGWAVHAELTADAGPYAPAVLPELREVAVGEALWGDSDAVAPLEAVTRRGGKSEVHAAMTPGEGVLMPGTDAVIGDVLRQSGHRLRAVDVAAMQALGITGARVRKPRIRVARAGRGQRHCRRHRGLACLRDRSRRRRARGHKARRRSGSTSYRRRSGCGGDDWRYRRRRAR